MAIIRYIYLVDRKKMQSPEIKREQNEDKSDRNLPNSSSDRGYSGHWTDTEQIKYALFLKKHHNKLYTTEHRRHWRIFKNMSAFITTRSANQCRSHHQKMERHFQTPDTLIEYLRTKIGFFDQKADIVYQQIIEEQNVNPTKKETLLKLTTEKNFPLSHEKQGSEPVKTEVTNFPPVLASLNEQQFPPYSVQPCNWLPNSLFFQERKKQGTLPMPTIDMNFLKQWDQCHENYKKWVTALKKLMEKPSI